MKQPVIGERPGLQQLQRGVEKNKKMVRRAAPITVENKGIAELEQRGETLYEKVQNKRNKTRRTFFSRIF